MFTPPYWNVLSEDIMDAETATPTVPADVKRRGEVSIGPWKIGPNRPCFVIAEAGVNHNGSREIAFRLVDAAVRAQANAVKFQTFISEQVISAAAPKAAYQRETTGSEESQLEMVKKLEFPPQVFGEIQSYCKSAGILFLSTPFEESSADVLEALDVPAFKIPSGEITNFPFLEHVARKGRPMIVSTGMSDLEEVRAAVEVIRNCGGCELVLLHCVSSYPANPAHVNLRSMNTLAHEFSVPVGFSDHTLGIEVALAAAALGATVIEKHLTLDKTLPGPDHRASVEPNEFAAMVRGIRMVESALGDGHKHPSPEELDTAAVARKSLVSTRALTRGTILTEDAVAIRRPGTGLAPSLRSQLIGRRLRRDVVAGELFDWEMIS
jgi:N-acetylneuraminate synthase/N,N'-diacetyllegionaminate synthase